MADPKTPAREQSSQSNEKSNFLEGGSTMKSTTPPSFNLTAGPIQTKGIAQLKAIDYEPYVKKVVPIFQEILKWKDNFFGVNEEYKAVKGAEIGKIIQEVQAAGGKTSEFLDEVKLSLGGDAAFRALTETMNDIGLTFALEGATSMRIKNLTEGEIKTAGGGQAFSIRSSASAKDKSNVLGDLNHSMEDLGPVVHSTYEQETKTQFVGIRIRKEGLPNIKLAGGKTLKDLPDIVWIGMGGLRMTVTWDLFLEQLTNFDTMTTGMPITEKLTKLRQFGQKADMGKQMDSELGTKAKAYGPFYEESRGSFSNIYQMLKEADQVETPMGVVDMHHFLIALESYQKKNKDVVLDPYWVTVGKMQDVGSFAGNIGAAAADFLVKGSKDYETSVGVGATDEERMKFYYRTRTTEAELLGELDGWGALPALESGKVSTLTELIKSYYGGAPVAGGAKKDHPRKAALQGFMSNYGLTSDGSTLNNAANVEIIYKINLTFAEGWWRNREGFWASTDPKDLKVPAKKMTEWFLDFLSARAKEYGVY